jgi:hypoxanthine phosphoribosyltransferase
MLNKDVKSVLLTEEKISETVKQIAEKINKDYEGKEILFVVILKGSLVFAADLMRQIKVPMRVDFMQASSYGSGTASSGTINIKKDIENNAEGKHVLIVEDIIDSGNTLAKIKKLFEERNAASVKICTLLSKPERRETDVYCEYIGTEIPDEFVIGYGLDYDENYRNLPYIGILKPEVYEK